MPDYSRSRAAYTQSITDCLHCIHLSKTQSKRRSFSLSDEIISGTIQLASNFTMADDKKIELKTMLHSLSIRFDALHADVKDQKTSLDSLTKTDKVRKADLHELNKNVKSILDNVNDINEKLNRLQLDVTAQGVRVDAVEKSLKDIQNRVTLLEQSEPATNTAITDDVRQRVDEVEAAAAAHSDDVFRCILQLETSDVGSHAVLTGLPESPGENLPALLITFCTLLSLKLQHSDILRTERMGKPLDAGRCRAIFIELGSRKLVNELITAKKKRRERIMARQLNTNWPNQSVNVYKRTPPSLRGLRNKVLEKFPGIDPHSVWCGESTVLVRRPGVARPFEVRTSSDIAKLPQ